MSPTNSSRTGCGAPAGKMSTMPPRTQNSPCSSAGSCARVAGAASRSARSVGEMSCPGVRSATPSSAASGGLTRGNSAAAEATTTRAVPRATRVQRARARRRDVEVRREAAIRIDLVRREAAAPRARPRRPSSPSSAEKKKRASAVSCSTSASVGTTSSTTARAAAAAAANSALAGRGEARHVARRRHPSRSRLAAALSTRSEASASVDV